MPVHVRVGGTVWSDLQYVRWLVEEVKCGDLVCPGIGRSFEKAMAMARYCRENDVALIQQRMCGNELQELLLDFEVPEDDAHKHGFYSKEEYLKIMKEFGSALVARMTLNEIGGTAYWPKAYAVNRAVGEWPQLAPAKDMAEAKRSYMRLVRKVIAQDRKWAPTTKLCDGDSSIYFKYHREAGVDLTMLEYMPADTDLAVAAARGASRDAADPRWISYIAMEAYGGKFRDELFYKRWRTALYHNYIAGASFINSESGHVHGEIHGSNFPTDHPETERYRSVLRDFYRFCRRRPRPKNGPKANVGIVHGNLDGYTGLWADHVWGQYEGDHWRYGPAEWSWEHVKWLHRKQPWASKTLSGDANFTGNPPMGQYDIVPIESSQKNLNRYKCLVFLGWNTMTAAIYRRLKEYVRRGGHLFMAVPHLSVETRRDKDIKLYRNGDFRDLFGVRVLGKGPMLEDGGFRFVRDSALSRYRFPCWAERGDPQYLGGRDIPTAHVDVARARVLAVTKYSHRIELETWREPLFVENRLGRGMAFLVTAWTWPGHSGLAEFYQDLFRAIIAAEQGPIRVSGADTLRHAVYNEAGIETVYLLNTDPDVRQEAHLHAGGEVFSVSIPPAEIRIVTIGRDGAVSGARRR